MFRRRPILIALIVAGLLLAALPARAATPTIQMIDAGAEPRQVLRLTPDVGLHQRVVVSTTTTAQVEVSLAPDPDAVTQTVRYVLDMEVTAVSAEGTITAALSVAEATTTNPPEGDRPDPTRLVGRTGTVTIRPDGVVTDVDLDGGEDDARGLVEAARQLTTPFPAEPIGPGAKWRVIDEMDLDVVTIKLITTCRLVGFDGHTATYSASLSTSVDEAELSIDDAKGVKAELTELDTSGTASIHQPVAGIAPSSREDTGRYVVGVKGRKGLMPFKLRMDISAASTTSASIE